MSKKTQGGVEKQRGAAFCVQEDRLIHSVPIDRQGRRGGEGQNDGQAEEDPEIEQLLLLFQRSTWNNGSMKAGQLGKDKLHAWPTMNSFCTVGRKRDA